MQHYNYENTSLNLVFPDTWGLEQDQNLISLCDLVNGVGALQFSVFFPPDTGTVSLKNELIDFVDDYVKEYIVTEGENFARTDYLERDEDY